MDGRDNKNQENPLLKPYYEDGLRSDNPYVNFYWDFCSQGKSAYAEVKFISLKEAIKVILDNGEVESFGGYEIMEVTDDGHLNISDFDWGLLNYDSEEKAYVQWYHFQKSVYRIKGFFDIEVRDE